MICGSDHTASALNAKIGVPRQAPKNLRPSDKLTPNPRSGSGGFDFTIRRLGPGAGALIAGPRDSRINCVAELAHPSPVAVDGQGTVKSQKFLGSDPSLSQTVV